MAGVNEIKRGYPFVEISPTKDGFKGINWVDEYALRFCIPDSDHWAKLVNETVTSIDTLIRAGCCISAAKLILVALDTFCNIDKKHVNNARGNIGVEDKMWHFFEKTRHNKDWAESFMPNTIVADLKWSDLGKLRGGLIHFGKQTISGSHSVIFVCRSSESVLSASRTERYGGMAETYIDVIDLRDALARGIKGWKDWLEKGGYIGMQGVLSEFKFSPAVVYG